jgi:hypothetical protein
VGVDRHQVAARLRELVGGLDAERVAKSAERLRIDEFTLRRSIDVKSPHPTLEVMVAAVREFGVDPNWLLTGDYSPTSHRRAMEEGVPGIIAAIDEITRRQSPSGHARDLLPDGEAGADL